MLKTENVSCGLFNERIAKRYDEASKAMFDRSALEPAVDILCELAGNGRALEFAIGTGRVALPLHARGVDVHGIELSQPMVDQLRAKDGGQQMPVTIGDMATTHIDGTFNLVFLVYNTISNLVTQDEQVQCFCNAADHLESGGYFVVEDTIPSLHKLPAGESFCAFDVPPSWI